MKALDVWSREAARKRSFPALISHAEQLISEANNLLNELRLRQDEHHALVQDFKAAMRPGANPSTKNRAFPAMGRRGR